MSKTKGNQPFEVIVLATDMFGYYWARSFHNQYNKKSFALGNYASEYTKLSNLFKEIRIEKDLFEEQTFVDTVINFAKDIKAKTPDHEIIVIPTNDHFVRYMIQNKDELSKYCLFNLPNENLLDSLMLKENFYHTVASHGLPIPETIFHYPQDDYDQSFINFPAIVKPSTAVGWKGLDFAEYEKVYYVKDQNELVKILKAIQKTAYTSPLIIQEYIQGDDTNLWDIVTYSNSLGKVEFINMGQVLLQEPAKTMVGNYTAVVSRYKPEFMKRIVDFLNDIGYTGFANFDMKLDPRDGQFKLFEVNLRAGRSSFSAEQMGESLAKNMVDDLIYNKHNQATHYMNKENLFSYVPKRVLKQYVMDKELNQETRDLIKRKLLNNPLVYPKDQTAKRSLFLILRALKYLLKYRRGTWNNQAETNNKSVE